MLEQLKWKKYSVLNDGFICLVDVMGNDSAIVQAARVSYGKDERQGYVDCVTGEEVIEKQKITPKDRSLIRRLMMDQHSSPFEQVEFKFKVRVPMDCWRQWIRHRTACLAGDTELVFNRPVDNRAYRLTVKEVFERFQPTVNTQRPDKQRNPYFKRERVQQMKLRSLNEKDGSAYTTNIVDIWETGVKQIFELVTETNKILKCSEDHRIHTPEGWKILKDLKIGSMLTIISSRIGVDEAFPNNIDHDSEEWIPLIEWEQYYEISSQGRVRRVAGGFGRPKKVTISNQRAVVSLNKPGKQQTILIHRAMLLSFGIEPDTSEQTEVCHNDGNSLNNILTNLRWGTSKENSEDMIEHNRSTYLTGVTDIIKSILSVGNEMTYDIEVSGPYHNFSANDIVVHNSVNEYSTRYSEAIDSQQTTEPTQWRLQAKNNKQGSSGFLEEWPEKWNTSIDNEKYPPQHPINTKDSNCKTPGQYLSAMEEDLINHSTDVYKERLEAGIAREQARKDLPLSTYTEAYWKCDLHNIFNFLRLRLDSHAQLEIRLYAQAMYEIVKQICPIACEAFEDYILQAKKFSRMEMEILRNTQDMFHNIIEKGKPLTMTDNEWTQFLKKLESN